MTYKPATGWVIIVNKISMKCWVVPCSSKVVINDFEGHSGCLGKEFGAYASARFVCTFPINTRPRFLKHVLPLYNIILLL